MSKSIDNWAMLIGQPTSIPTFEEMEANRMARFAGKFQEVKAAHPDWTVFPATSLTQWVALAEQAGIAMVSARVAMSLPVTLIMSDGDIPVQHEAVAAQLRSLQAELKPNEMARFEYAASMDLKAAMANGIEQSNVEDGYRSLASALYCPRLMELAYTFPASSVDVLVRPWVDARMHETHPVEYRVFVQDGQVKGVANYYIQRDLPDDAQVRAEIAQVIAASRKLIAHGMQSRTVPYNAESEDPRNFSCSLDFLVSQESGEVLFLEAGPAFGFGAHPCAFINNRVTCGQASSEGMPAREMIVTEGVALSVDGPVQPLVDFDITS